MSLELVHQVCCTHLLQFFPLSQEQPSVLTLRHTLQGLQNLVSEIIYQVHFGKYSTAQFYYTTDTKEYQLDWGTIYKIGCLNIVLMSQKT